METLSAIAEHVQHWVPGLIVTSREFYFPHQARIVRPEEEMIAQVSCALGV